MTEELRRFDAIRPFEPEELPAVFDRLLADPQFQKVLASVFPGAPLEAIGAKMRACKTCLDFQKTFCYDFLKGLLAKVSDGCDFDTGGLDTSLNYTFVSNHRDIVLDSALLDMLLLDAGFATTCEIAIGDNLLAAPWIKDLVRVNKSFIVERGASPRELLAHSKLMAEYMHYVIWQKKDNIWIAQREGRAKDSDDRTQSSILKMMAMGGEGPTAERLMQLRIVPLAISYEYDPCDFLKAKEMQLRRDNPDWKKTKADDITSMTTGIMGRKGRIHYRCGHCMSEFLDFTPDDMPKGVVINEAREFIDREIHRNYRLYPINYIALDELNGTQDHADNYTPDDKRTVDEYIAGQLAKIDLPNKDEAFLRARILLMYANPAKNCLETLANLPKFPAE